jgi:hypothetical protein
MLSFAAAEGQVSILSLFVVPPHNLCFLARIHPFLQVGHACCIMSSEWREGAHPNPAA